MAKLPKCPYCNQDIQPNEPKKPYKGRHYHATCYKKYCAEIYVQNQGNTDSKQQLYDYICTLFSIKELSPFLTAQLRKFENEYNMTYDGMWFSLKYYFEILDNKPEPKKGIGIIPYIYDEAKRFYQKLTALKAKDYSEIKQETVNVKVSAQKTPKPAKRIDIENL